MTKNMRNLPAKVAGRDYEGIIIDLLDDIVLAEKKAQRLIDRLDSISKSPSMRVINMDSIYWLIAGISLASCFFGVVLGFGVRALM